MLQKGHFREFAAELQNKFENWAFKDPFQSCLVYLKGTCDTFRGIWMAFSGNFEGTFLH